jgi:DNA-binding MarR family transcriptional regulator
MARLDAGRLEAWRLFLQAHARLVDVLEDDLEPFGLPLPAYEVLVRLANAPDRRLRMRDLAASVLLSRSGITRLVDRMEAAGWVGRERCPGDRRGLYAVLTSDGLSALRRAGPTHRRGVVEHFASRVTDDELPAVTAALRRIVEG